MRMASTSGKYLYSVARPIPVFSAISDIVTDASPCSPTSAAVVSRIASFTSRRCVSIVSVQSFGTREVYDSPYCDTMSPSKSRPSREETTWLNGRGPGPEDDAPTPAWLYVGGILVIIIALAFVAMHLSGGV